MNRINILIIVLIVASSFGKPETLFSEEFNDSHTGIFSNLKRDIKTGDMSGIELFVMHSNSGYYLTYQCAAGEIAPPVLLPAKIEKSNIEFKIPNDFKFFCNFGTFKGTIDMSGIKGRFSNNEEFIFLIRKQSYWQNNKREVNSTSKSTT